MSGQRPSTPAAATSLAHLHLGLLGNFERVVNFDPKIPDRALEFRVSEQELHSSEILSPPVDQCRFSATQRMGAVGSGVESKSTHPGPNNPGVLPCR